MTSAELPGGPNGEANDLATRFHEAGDLLDVGGDIARRCSPQRLASLAYDATALAALLTAEDGTADYSPAALSTPQGFFGVEGLFRLRPEGPSERGLAIHEVAEGEIRTRRDAPQAFGVGTN